MTLEFGRIITAMATPFDHNGDVNYPEAIRLAQHLYDTGTDAIVLAGTTGESPTLTHDEEFQRFKEIRTAFPKKKIIAGTVYGNIAPLHLISVRYSTESCCSIAFQPIDGD